MKNDLSFKENEKCLYLDDELPIDLIHDLSQEFNLHIDVTQNIHDFEHSILSEKYKLIFLDIRLKGDIVGQPNIMPWQRAGLYILKKIREGVYEPRLNRNIPIIVITAVADVESQNEIISIGRSVSDKNIFALFEKPADNQEVGLAVLNLLNN